ncbi:DEAD/DEAH box helicase [Enterococcus faecalis]|nr:DEAD/DEAH box helicase family protein [Enterococcus faecalis]EKK0949025.1 DEAD/DEAH box helicase family protein [Enterococcus faecalis]
MKSNTTFGEIFFEKIDENEYLKKLYEDILYNYALKVFGYTRRLKRNLAINDALRFADILSKSNHSTKADKHKVWAQEIVTMLNYIYPENPDVLYVAGSVLTSVGNYQGRNIIKSDFNGADAMEKIYLELKKDYYTIPSAPDKQFMVAQKSAYDHFANSYYSYSAPTSMGKSFIMRMFIKEKILSDCRHNFAIVVPTKALINEIRIKITKEDLGEILHQKNYHVVTAAGDAALSNWKDKGQNYIFVMTPERMLYLMINEPDIQIDYLFVDEAHKITGADKRSPFYYQVVNMLSERPHRPHIIFASPNVPNPEVFLDTIPDVQSTNEHKLQTSYSPVSQPKFIINLINREVSIYNEHNDSNIPITSIALDDADLIDVLLRFEKDEKQKEKPFIVYFPSTRKTVVAARDFGANRIPKTNCQELMELSKDIKNEVHGDYYLADLVSKGVAYHIGYLPTSIRQRIEDLFKAGKITALFCTSTLVEGVNLPADNLFITDYRNGQKDMRPIDFRNLVGRVGRLEFNLYGNVFLVATSEKASDKFETLLSKSVDKQTLSIEKGLTKPQKQNVIDVLLQGDVEFPKHPQKQTEDSYDLMRKFAIILLNDIMANRESRVRKEFQKVMKPGDEDLIKAKFSNRQQHMKDSDITVSVDQSESLYEAIANNGLEFPAIDSNGRYDATELWDFLLRIAKIFKWKSYESYTLGAPGNDPNKYSSLSYYRVILGQWVSGHGLQQIISEAIRYKKNNPHEAMFIDGKKVDYKEGSEHNNIIISEVLSVIDKIILFKLSNYFLKISNAYKDIKGKPAPNDWYEFVEYGSTNKRSIEIQKYGFSRESALYILQHEAEYVYKSETELKLKKSLLECPNKGVKADAELAWYNTPELFLEEEA